MSSKKNKKPRKAVKAKKGRADAKTPPQNIEARQPSGPKDKAQQSWWRRLPAWVKIVGASPLVGVMFAFYFQYAPSWSLDLPSASFRPENPFTAVFTITNVGYLPASHVSVQCMQKMVEYSNPPNGSSSSLVGEPSTSNWMSRNGKLSVICPQVVANFQVFLRALSEKEITELARQGPKLNENPHVIWADLIFTVKYAPIAIFPLLTWTEKLRVKGELGEDGNFVWMHIPIEQIYDRPSYHPIPFPPKH
jgi:hypothetical protein